MLTKRKSNFNVWRDNFRMDILYQSESSGMQVALGTMNDPGKFSVVKFSEFIVTDDENCATPSSSDLISIPNSNAFVDFNGDCMADIFLTRQKADGSTYYEIYAAVEGKNANGSTAQKFCLAA